MIRKALVLVAAGALVLLLSGCQSMDGVGKAVQGMGQDLCRLSNHRVVVYKQADQNPLYYSEIGGERAYFRRVNDQYVRVAVR